MQTQHAGNTGAVEVDIQETNARMLTRQGQREVDGRHTFPDPAFAAHDYQLVLDASHTGLDLLHLFGNLRHDLGVVGILEFAEDGFQVLLNGHCDAFQGGNKGGTVTQRF